MRRAAHHAAKKSVQQAQSVAATVTKAQETLAQVAATRPLSARAPGLPHHPLWSQVSALEKHTSRVLSRVKTSQQHTAAESDRMASSLQHAQHEARQAAGDTAQRVQKNLAGAQGTEQELLSQVKHSVLEQRVKDLQSRDQVRREHQVCTVCPGYHC